MNNTKVIIDYLHSQYPDKVNIVDIGGDYSMRFELGGQLKNGTRKRVKQAVLRAVEIYKQSLGLDEVLLVCEVYKSGFMGNKLSKKSYLEELLREFELKKFKGTFTTTVKYERMVGGELKKVEKPYEIKLPFKTLLLGIVKMDESLLFKILEGKANEEMGFEPSISENITFFSINKCVGFRMYDDRGCDVWAKKIESLNNLYENLNDWILDYNRPEIDKMFEVNKNEA